MKAYELKTGKADFYEVANLPSSVHVHEDKVNAWTNSDGSVYFKEVKTLFPNLHKKYGKA